jgi:glyoxylase-like metal-dependent hydrolase (beta-lactamase superfamily II)
VREIASGVFWLRMPLPFALNHINLWLLRDGKGWTAVDCGIALDPTRVHWEQIFREVVGNAGLTRVLVTHFHPDHFGNAGWLTQRFDAPLWMSESEYLNAHAQYQTQAGFGADATARLFAEHGLDPESVAAIKGRGNPYRKIVSEPPTRFMRILDGDEIDIGGKNWRVIVGWGHAPEHAALYCESLGVLISGDMLLPKISTNVSVWPTEPKGDPLKLFLRSIDRFAELPADTLVLPRTACRSAARIRGCRCCMHIIATVWRKCSNPAPRRRPPRICCRYCFAARSTRIRLSSRWVNP